MKHSFCEHPAYTPSPSEDNSALPPQNGQVSSDCQCGNLRSNIITPPVPGRDRLSFIKTFHPHTASITGNTVQCQPVAAGAVYRDISTSAKRARFKFLHFSDLLTHPPPLFFFISRRFAANTENSLLCTDTNSRSATSCPQGLFLPNGFFFFLKVSRFADTLLS